MTGSEQVEPPAFAATVRYVRGYVRHEPGAWSALAALARADPEGTTRALLALGTVLLDVAAEAFQLRPEEMLAKVSATVDLAQLEASRRADSR